MGANGEVVDVKAAGPSPLASIEACLLDAVKQAKFPPPPGGSAVLAIPVTFVIQH